SSTHEMSLYINGQLVGTEQAVTIPTFSRTDMSIGSSYGGFRASDVSLDGFRISTRSRAAGEIAADYSPCSARVGITVRPVSGSRADRSAGRFCKRRSRFRSYDGADSGHVCRNWLAQRRRLEPGRYSRTRPAWFQRLSTVGKCPGLGLVARGYLSVHATGWLL